MSSTVVVDDEVEDSSVVPSPVEEVVEGDEEDSEQSVCSANASITKEPSSGRPLEKYPAPKKMKKSATPLDQLEVEILKEIRRSQPSETTSPDEDDLFGQSVAATLKNLSPRQKALAKMRMQQLLYEVQFCPPQHPLPPAFSPPDSLY